MLSLRACPPGLSSTAGMRIRSVGMREFFIRISLPPGPRRSMNKPRIVHMVEAYEKVGGPPRLVRLITASPLHERYDFHVLSYSISGFNLKAIFDLRRQIVRLKPDIVHVHGLKSDGLLATVAARW